MDSKQKYRVIGLMSGTSLDGLDIACCSFQKKEQWQFKLERSETIQYSSLWRGKLKNAHLLPAQELAKLDVDYGELIGEFCKRFITKNKITKVDFVASHGHTIFHQPKKRITTQIGNGNNIHATSGLPVIYDFRSLDVARGGQGAPLVPMGDKLLFTEYGVCLNLGGIANLSFDNKKSRTAFDICFLNMGLNYLANKTGKKYDRNGSMASSGEINTTLLTRLTGAYKKIKTVRPSFGREFFEKHFLPLLDQDEILVQDRLTTFVESAAQEISEAILRIDKKVTVLCSGGGTFNSFLIYRLVELCGDDVTLIIPEDDMVKFKEALVFAFLGVLRVRGEVNCLKSVTGASQDSSGGISIGFS